MTNFVLLHGTYQGGWIWQKVASRLRAAGHLVYAPTLDGCAERKGQARAGINALTQADEVAQFLFYEDLRDAVLVGTSSGGMVACRTAELMRDRVSRLVFLDAVALLPGEALRDIVVRSTPVVTGVVAGPTREDAENRLFAELDPPTKAWALERYTPHPVGVREQPMQLDSFWSLPWKATVVWCRRAVNPGEAHQRRTAERLNAQWAEFDTGHFPMLSMPDDTVRLILQ
ncbi:MAG TPA: alpha/beta hydrolase [Stellaceae bacterium]|jgi:pimeloyl-ACP methyl ester carboxylesterase|nr:alpha/beta hydrolase [Stellaceae bacterium]